MVNDAARAYLALATGLTEATRDQARNVVRALASRSGATAEQVQSLAEDVLEAGRTNRETLIAVVRAELERGLATLGLATAEEVARLTRRIDELERGGRSATRPAAARAAKKPAAKKPAAKKPAAKKPAAKKPAAKKPAAKKPAAKKPAATTRKARS